jgi:putative membrane protein
MFHDPWGFMWFGPLFWIIILGVIIYFIISGRNKRPWNTSDHETPLDTLKKRYARGEITKEQYDQMKKDIE